MDVSVILATYNRSARLKEMLGTLSQMSVPKGLSWELILVDNNSTDDTKAAVEELAGKSALNVEYVFEKTQGKSSALNTGVRQAKGDIIAFTDDDVIVDPEWLTEIARAFVRFDCLAVAGRVVPVWEQPQPLWLDLEDQQAVVHFDYGEFAQEIDIAPIGANMAFRRQIFEQYGLFRVGLSVYKRQSGGTEDMEFGLRLLSAGQKIMYVPEAVIYHPVDQNRATKKYVLHWALTLGKKMSQARLWPADAVKYRGVPRYLFRSLVEDSLKYAVSLDRKQRFKYKVRAYREYGEICEVLQNPEAVPTEIPTLVPTISSSSSVESSPNSSFAYEDHVDAPIGATVEEHS